MQWLLLLQSTGSRAHRLQQLWHMGSTSGHMSLVAPWHVKSSWTRDQTPVSCIGRQILNHWTTREVQSHVFMLEIEVKFLSVCLSPPSPSSLSPPFLPFFLSFKIVMKITASHFFEKTRLFNWRIIALKCCISFCCTTMWISYMYTHILSLLNLLPTPSHPYRSSHLPSAIMVYKNTFFEM